MKAQKYWITVLVILILGLLVVGVYLIANQPQVETTKLKCSPENLSACNRSCEKDEECKFTFGCGCIFIEEECTSKLATKPHPCQSCRCTNGECKSWMETYEKAINTGNRSICLEIRNEPCKQACLEGTIKRKLEIKMETTNYTQGEEIKAFVAPNQTIYIREGP